jgi:hypothetical protein
MIGWPAAVFHPRAPARYFGAVERVGERATGHLGGPIKLERAEVIESRHATHLRYRILN